MNQKRGSTHPKHHFLFVTPNNLSSSEQDSNHLKQNYVMGFALKNNDGKITLSLDEEWTENLNIALAHLNSKQFILKKDMQIDNRYNNLLKG